MQTFVYASERKTGTYVWLRERDQFEALPEALRHALGELRFVLDVDLDGDRTLPRETPGDILAHLHSRGWHLQMPPAVAEDADPGALSG